jgi:hypothetical protein
LVITLPTGQHPQLTIAEGSIGNIEFNGQEFGFRPTFADNSDTDVIVKIFDMSASPNRELGTVDLTVGGSPVTSDTTPKFTLNVPRISTK